MFRIATLSNQHRAKKQAATSVMQAQPTAALDIPERPRLAAKIELAGEMQDTGFQESQWLIQREGQFIQVSELIYRVAEQLDGNHTLEEIAANLTASSPWTVTAENVRQVIQLKLIPLRLVEGAREMADLSEKAARERRSGSPLTVNLRKN